MKRYLHDFITKDLRKKMVFLSGPRQSGKTTLGWNVINPSQNPGEKVEENDRYYNWDDDADREKILKKEFPTQPGYLFLDEIHKYRNWRQVLKSLFDKRGKELQILVSGSAKLDYYRRGGDSLQGRYNLLRLHPLSVAELGGSEQTLENLMVFGGFPEPYFSQSESEARRWSRQYRTRLIREELQDLERVSEISLLEQMAIRLPELVGSPLSLNALREDLKVSHQTVSRWISYLENLYAIFRIYPFGADRIRAVKKEAKHYHYDWTLIEEPGKRFENLVACHLLKWCHYIEDIEGWDMELRYFRDIDRREVDFVVLKQRKPLYFIEVKRRRHEISPHLKYLHKKFPNVEAIQVSLDEPFDLRTSEGIRNCHAYSFLKDLI